MLSQESKIVQARRLVSRRVKRDNFSERAQAELAEFRPCGISAGDLRIRWRDRGVSLAYKCLVQLEQGVLL